jgi:hypothetical protein
MINLPTLGKDVEILEKTRKMTRLVNETMLAGVTVTDGQPTSIPAINADKSEELLIRLMTNLTQEEIDKLSMAEYDNLKEEIAKKK